MKKITYLLTALLFFCGTVSVLAADSSIKYNSDIVFDDIYEGQDNFISLKNTLKDDKAVVYQQYVEISEEQFSKINSNIKGVNNYKTEQEKIIKSKKEEVDAAKKVLDNAEKPLGHLDIEQSEIDIIINEENKNLTITESEYQNLTQSAYYDAYTKYQKLLKEYIEYVNTYQKNLEQKVKDMYASIPSFDDTKWNTLKLSSTTDSANKYKVSIPTTLNYAVSWAKVDLNNGDSNYNFGLICKNSYKTPEKPKTPENPKNPKTGIKEYSIYTILISLVAASGYVVARKMRKFSK